MGGSSSKWDDETEPGGDLPPVQFTMTPEAEALIRREKYMEMRAQANQQESNDDDYPLDAISVKDFSQEGLTPNQGPSVLGTPQAALASDQAGDQKHEVNADTTAIPIGAQEELEATSTNTPHALVVTDCQEALNRLEVVEEKSRALVESVALSEDAHEDPCAQMKDKVEKCYRVKTDVLDCKSVVDEFVQCTQSHLFARLSS